MTTHNIKKHNVNLVAELHERYTSNLVPSMRSLAYRSWNFDPNEHVVDLPLISDAMSKLIGVTNEQVCESTFVNVNDSYRIACLIDQYKHSVEFFYPETVPALNNYNSMFCVLKNVNTLGDYAIALKASSSCEHSQNSTRVIIKILDESSVEGVEKLFNKILRLEKKEKREAYNKNIFKTPGQTCRGKIGPSTKQVTDPVTGMVTWEPDTACMIGELVRYNNGGGVGKRGWLYEIIEENLNEPDPYVTTYNKNKKYYTYKIKPVFTGLVSADQTKKPNGFNRVRGGYLIPVDIMSLAMAVANLQKILQHTFELKSGGEENILTDESE